MRIPGKLMPHQIIVRAYTGWGSTGPVLDQPRLIRAYVEDSTTVVRDGTGQEVPASAEVWLDPEEHLEPLSEVTLWPASPRQRVEQVITCDLFDHPQAPSHVHLYVGTGVRRT